MAISESELSTLIAYNRRAVERITPVFQNRTEAGIQLAHKLDSRGYPNPVIIAIPNGGIPVALPIAEGTKTPIHLFFAAKIPCSSADERFGIGTVTATNKILLNGKLLRELDIGEDITTRGIRAAQRVVKRKFDALASLILPIPTDLCGKTVIIVDDGVASGFTALAAVAELERFTPERIVIAAAVCSPYGQATLAAQAVELIAGYQAIGPEFLLDNFFANFEDLTAADTQQLMQNHLLHHQTSEDSV